MTIDPEYIADASRRLREEPWTFTTNARGDETQENIVGNIFVFPTPAPVRKPSKTEQIYDLLRRGPFEVANLANTFGCSHAAIRAIVQDIRRKGGFVLGARSGKHQYYAIASGPRTYAKLLRDRRQQR